MPDANSGATREIGNDENPTRGSTIFARSHGQQLQNCRKNEQHGEEGERKRESTSAAKTQLEA
ncbi:hypothetical protein TIFTF001_009108 [Ficus carica]|uniref:Uncharacterized protein n=1 Tax=Ficus carica TaxID=3494 RepID=A0AA87ZUP5_FICCA|nr:hypothetical protein TIFTF001_009108 [Ficus carica]